MYSFAMGLDIRMDGNCIMSFQGAFRFFGGKKLSENQYRYLLLFWQVERYYRNTEQMRDCPDPLRDLVGLPLGAEGEFFVSSKEFLDLPTECQTQFLETRRFGDELPEHRSGWATSQIGLVKNYPHGQYYISNYQTFQYPKAFRDRKEPCNWVPTRDGLGIEWFYNRCWQDYDRALSLEDAVFWIQWISDNILKPWGLTLEGEVWYQGESQKCTGRLVVLGNGSIVKQTARSDQATDMLGAAASNCVWLAKTLPHEQLTMKDPFGRTPLLLAVWFKSHEMLDWLSTQLQGDTWQLDAVFVRGSCPTLTHFIRPFDHVPSLDGASVFHFLPSLDAYNPAVPRFLSRLALADIPVDILESFIRFPYIPEQGPDDSEMYADVDSNLHNPLTYAVASENRLVVEWLLTVGADPNCHRYYPEYDTTPRFDPVPFRASWPLVHAATCKDTSILRLLLERGADIHVSRRPTSSRWGVGERELFVHTATNTLTPLHLAAYHARYDNIQLLVFHGADLRRECNLVDPTNRGHIFVGFNASGTARDAVVMGTIADYLARRHWDSQEPLQKNAIANALEEYDAALQDGLKEKRLFVLCCLTKSGDLERLPGPLVGKIFNLASLLYDRSDF